MLIADMRGLKVENAPKKDELFEILRKYDKKTPFKSIILDIRSILPKKRYKMTKKGLEYVEEIKELTFLQIENFKNKLIKGRDDLIEKFKKNDRIKKADKDYYEYENDKFYGLKDIRNLFDKNDDDDDIYVDIECLFNESIILYEMKQNGLEYEEIKKLMFIQEEK